MITTLFFLFSITAKRFDQEIIFLEPIGDRYASGIIYIGSKAGIVGFNLTNSLWSRFTTANGLPDNDIKIIGIDQGILWVVTEQGICSADIKINDWQTYSLQGVIQCLDFDENYVYAGGDSGLFRFDKYNETWEKLYSSAVYDIQFDREFLWLTTEKGIIRYDRAIERFEEITSVAPGVFSKIVATPGYIWFLDQKRAVVYKREGELWSEYRGIDINDLVWLGDSLFVLSNNTVHFYNPRTRSLQEFRDFELPDETNGISIFQGKILLATNNGIYTCDFAEKSRQVHNRNNGMLKDTIIDVYENNSHIFAVGSDNIQFLNKTTGVWQMIELTVTFKRKPRVFTYDDAGLHTGVIGNTDLRLQGYATGEITLYSVGSQFSNTKYENLNLRLIGEHKSKRAISGYYDDTDKQNVIYGFGYRGLENDFLVWAQGGYQQSEYADFDLVPAFYSLGASARLGYQDNNLNLQAGQIKSAFYKEYFRGYSSAKTDTLLDIDYARHFYYIYGSPNLISKGYDTVFVDDRIASNNTYKTRTGYTIAGITGDFDVFINGADYFIDYRTGSIHFLSPRKWNDIIVLLLNGEQIIIQSDSIQSHQRENIYVLGAEIIPGSIRMTIIDTAGTIYPLSQFGLDNNLDNQIDEEFVNHKLGFIAFPSKRPFPDAVYDDTLNIFRMVLDYQTSATFYRLRHFPLLIGSEKVYVDNEPLVCGRHYILDYTSGILFFVDRSLINDFSEIEIQYLAIDRGMRDFYYSVQSVIRINRSSTISPGYAHIIDDDIFYISGRLQPVISDNLSIKFMPQTGINSNKEYGHSYNLTANYGLFGVSAEYRGFSERFPSYGISQMQYGYLKHAGSATGSIGPFYYFYLDALVSRQYEYDILENKYETRTYSTRLSYQNPALPRTSLLMAREFLPGYSRNKILINTNASNEFRKTKLTLRGTVNNNFIETDTNTHFRTFGYVIESNLKFPFAVAGNFLYQNNQLYSENKEEKGDREMRLGLNMDFVPGLYYTGNYGSKINLYYLKTLKDIELDYYFYNSLNIAPGRWHKAFSIINISLGLGQNTKQYLDGIDYAYEPPIIISKPLPDYSISCMSNSNNLTGAIQLLPLANLTLWFKETFNTSGYALYYEPDMAPTYTEEIRIEYEQKTFGFFRANWVQKRYYTFPKNTVQILYLEWHKPWTYLFTTKLYTNYKKEMNVYSVQSVRNSEIKSGGQILFRLSPKNFLTMGFSINRIENYGQAIRNIYSPGSSLNFNFIRILYLSCSYEASLESGSPANHTLSCRLSGQF